MCKVLALLVLLSLSLYPYALRAQTTNGHDTLTPAEIRVLQLNC